LVIVIIGISARPEKSKELLQTLESIVDQVRNVSGCEQSSLYLNVEKGTDFIVLEKWANKQDLDDHQRSDIFTVLQGSESLMRRPSEIIIHTTG